jgi:hypothetical protein
VVSTDYATPRNLCQNGGMSETWDIMQDAARQMIQDAVDERGDGGIPWLMTVLGVKTSVAVGYLLNGWRWRKKTGADESERVRVPVELWHIAALADDQKVKASDVLKELLVRVKALEGERRAARRAEQASASPLVEEHPNDENGTP